MHIFQEKNMHDKNRGNELCMSSKGGLIWQNYTFFTTWIKPVLWHHTIRICERRITLLGYQSKTTSKISYVFSHRHNAQKTIQANSPNGYCLLQHTFSKASLDQISSQQLEMECPNIRTAALQVKYLVTFSLTNQLFRMSCQYVL